MTAPPAAGPLAGLLVADCSTVLAGPYCTMLLADLGALVEMEHPTLGPVRQVAPPFVLGATPATVRTPPPLLGEQSDEILAELGYQPAEIDRMRAAGTI